MTEEIVEQLEAKYADMKKKAAEREAALIVKGTEARFLLAQETLKQQVRKGIELLDKELPAWRTKVDPARLDMQFGSTCVLGQMFDLGRDKHANHTGYARGIWFLFGSDENDGRGQEHGFLNSANYWDHDIFPFGLPRLKALDELLYSLWREQLLGVRP